MELLTTLNTTGQPQRAEVSADSNCIALPDCLELSNLLHQDAFMPMERKAGGARIVQQCWSPQMAS